MLKSKHLYSPSNVFIISIESFSRPYWLYFYPSPCTMLFLTLLGIFVLVKWAFPDLILEMFIPCFMGMFILFLPNVFVIAKRAFRSLICEMFSSYFTRCLFLVSLECLRTKWSFSCLIQGYLSLVSQNVYYPSCQMYLLLQKVLGLIREVFILQLARCLFAVSSNMFTLAKETCNSLARCLSLNSRDVYSSLSHMRIPYLSEMLIPRPQTFIKDSYKNSSTWG